MRERPILFTDCMVRAIQTGQKTVTRREIVSRSRKRPHMVMVENHQDFPGRLQPFQADEHGSISFEDKGQCEFPIACPYGQVGDRLWVREAWEDVHPVQVTDGRYSQPGRAGIPGPPGVSYRTIYRADGPYPQTYPLPEYPYRSLQPGTGLLGDRPAENGWTGWMPSIHMPREASRILLEITDVRIERLHNITPEQAMAEGVQSCRSELDPDGNDYLPCELFDILWVSINGMDSWHCNPWLWVVEFRVIKP